MPIIFRFTIWLSGICLHQSDVGRSWQWLWLRRLSYNGALMFFLSLHPGQREDKFLMSNPEALHFFIPTLLWDSIHSLLKTELSYIINNKYSKTIFFFCFYKDYLFTILFILSYITIN